MKFKVSSMCGLSEAGLGEIISIDDLAGCNIQALLDAGHIVPAEAKIKVDVKSESAED